MRDHLVIVSEESVYAGFYKCGIGEVVDTLADALRNYLDVTIITPGSHKGGNMAGSMGGRIRLGLHDEEFYVAAAELVNEIQPAMVQNFGRPDFIDRLTVDCQKILVFDRWEEDIAGQLDSVAKYDHVVTLSTGYANELMAVHPEAVEWPLHGIINGISSSLYSTPRATKEESRRHFYGLIGRKDTGKPLMVTTGRLSEVKGTAELIAATPAIAAAGADLVVYGDGDAEYEAQLIALHEAGKLTFVPRLGDYFETSHALAAADFYLTPSLHEVCGLQPMKAARMGCVPIVRPVGGMGENFNESNAVLITDTIEEAVSRAVAMTSDEYGVLRDNCIAGQWTWETRVLPWLALFDLKTGPESESAFRAVHVITRRATPVGTAKKCPFAKKGG